MKSLVTEEGKNTPMFKKGRKEDLGNYKLASCTSWAWEDHAVDATGSNVKAHMRQGDNLRQPVWLHHGQIIHDQSDGLICIPRQREGSSCCLPGVL